MKFLLPAALMVALTFPAAAHATDYRSSHTPHKTVHSHSADNNALEVAQYLLAANLLLQLNDHHHSTAYVKKHRGYYRTFKPSRVVYKAPRYTQKRAYRSNHGRRY